MLSSCTRGLSSNHNATQQLSPSKEVGNYGNERPRKSSYETFSRPKNLEHYDHHHHSRRRKSYGGEADLASNAQISIFHPSNSSSNNSEISPMKTDDTTSLLYSSIEKVPIPSGYAGVYTRYVPASKWSRIFSSPGDFTIKLVGTASTKTNETPERLYKWAVLCAWLTKVDSSSSTSAPTFTRGPKIKAGFSQRLASYVVFTTRRESELRDFMKRMSLRCPGRALYKYYPSSKSNASERGVRIISFLDAVLSTTAVGHNKLVPVIPAMVDTPIVRSIIGISPVISNINTTSSTTSNTNTTATGSSTSSCSGRIERQVRSTLPSQWLSMQRSEDEESDQWRKTENSPPPSPSNSITAAGLRHLHLQEPANCQKQHLCARYQSPSDWKQRIDEENDSVFTVEVSSIRIIKSSYAVYELATIVASQVPFCTAKRRYSEFQSLLNYLSNRITARDIKTLEQLLPAKTLLRSFDTSFLEKRSEELQKFITVLLQMKIQGLLGEEVPMVAEPQVRKFLSLPAIEWKLIPSTKQNKKMVAEVPFFFDRKPSRKGYFSQAS